MAAGSLGVVGGRFVVASIGMFRGFGVVLSSGGVVGSRRAMVVAGVAFLKGGSHK